MIVYRNYIDTINTSEKITYFEKILANMGPLKTDLYDQAVSLLIETGELETGITDFYCTEKDFSSPEIAICRNISVCAGAVLHSLWLKGILLKRKLLELKSKITTLRSLNLPEQIKIGVPEGFVYYGLYPETYLESTHQFLKEMKPQKVIVLGLRSIGTQLSALVTAQLENAGCSVNSFTVRPKGHPFNRFIVLDDKLKRVIQSSAESHVIIVDEGPGLSGSSIGGTLRELKDLGVTSEKMILFPSWLPQGDTFISDNARNLWNLYKKYAGSFEKQWILNGKLEKYLERKVIYDISAGMWRSQLLKSESDYPPVHPHHERRKYLLVSNYYEKSSHWIAKFAGLGRYGSQNVLRADRLSNNGFSPPIHKLSSGFAVMEYIKGKQLTINDVDDTLIEFARKYLSFINDSMSVSLRVTYDSMTEMIYYNIANGLGLEWCQYLDKLKKFPKSLYEQSVVAIDGHMMPHEFLRTEKGIIKVDHIEHHADQFFHGCQNIAWDVAGFCVEFNLDKRKQSEFVDRMKQTDPLLSHRVPFFIIAYLAYRLGYVTMAADSLPAQQDALRFEKSKLRYSEMLKAELQQL